MDQPHPLPPESVMHSLIDTFFGCKERAYSGIPESFFRQMLEDGTLPRYMLLAVLAAAVPLTTEPFYDDTKNEAAASYAQQSWLSIIADGVTADALRIEAVRTLSVLVILDMGAGMVKAALQKAEMMVEAAQKMKLLTEGPSCLSFVEQEERRRFAWTLFIEDSMFTLGKSRPVPALQSDQFTLQLPCDEEVFLAGEWQDTLTLNDLLIWDFPAGEELNPFCRLVLACSVLGRCTHYVYEGDRDQVPPWDEDSGYSRMFALLLETKPHFRNSQRAIMKTFQSSVATTKVDAGFDLFSYMIFHLCHCLTSHPFIARQHLKPFGLKRMPETFTACLLDRANDHARQLLDLLDPVSSIEVKDFKVRIHHAPYFTAVAGGILSLVANIRTVEGHDDASDAAEYFSRSLEILQKFGRVLPAAVNILSRLREFHAHHSRIFAASLDPARDSYEIDSDTEQVLSIMLDQELVVEPIPQSGSVFE
ncbi:hypothetical protein BDW74DRAFT_172966 [Aspergillus multicolor]|uniref:fungal specific transcription factor domain-containing protein n=1 Tax=Aspergillus multicolor TaxID=41759 RepID=UPI003CCD5A16